jgi:ATP-dependent Clp protease protease subunit
MTRDKEDFNVDLPPFSPFELVLAEARYVILYGEIDDVSAREINTKIISMGIKNSRKKIYIEINSPGGEVAAGVAIMNTIRMSPAPIITMINGEACSMGGIISVAADYRIITPTSYWMGHPMEDIVGGNPQTIKDRGNYLEKLEADLNVLFKEKTKLSEEDFQKMMRGELWLNTQECLEKGIVDEIRPYLTPCRKPKAKPRKVK